MGSYVELTIHDLVIDWGKNQTFSNHGCLFDATDLRQEPIEYAEDDGDRVTYTREIVRRPLSLVVDRLELLGYTVPAAERMVASSDNGIDDSLSSLRSEIANALQQIDLGATTEYDDTQTIESHGRLVRTLYTKLVPFHSGVDATSLKWHINDVLTHLDPYVILRLLARNPDNLSRDVVWDYGDIVEGRMGGPAGYCRLTWSYSPFLGCY